METLLDAPFFPTFSASTMAGVQAMPTNALLIQFLYLRQKALLPDSPAILVNEYQLSGSYSYRLGKFILTAGVTYDIDNREGLFQKRQLYYFFRLYRPLRIF